SFLVCVPPPPTSTRFPYTTLFRSIPRYVDSSVTAETWDIYATMFGSIPKKEIDAHAAYWAAFPQLRQDLFTDSDTPYVNLATTRSEEHTSELQSRENLVCRLLLEK